MDAKANVKGGLWDQTEVPLKPGLGELLSKNAKSFAIFP